MTFNVMTPPTPACVGWAVKLLFYQPGVQSIYYIIFVCNEKELRRGRERARERERGILKKFSLSPVANTDDEQYMVPRESLTMAILLNGNSSLIAHFWGDIGYLIFLRHLFSSRAFTSLMFSFYLSLSLSHSLTTTYPLSLTNILSVPCSIQLSFLSLLSTSLTTHLCTTFFYLE